MKKIILNKVDKNTTKIEKEFKKRSNKMKNILIVLAMLTAVYLGDKAYTKMANWRNEHKIIRQRVFEFKIKLQFPYKIEEIKKVEKEVKIPKKLEPIKPVKELTEQEIIMTQKHGEILWKIYGLESTWGKNDGCRLNKKGFGGFGVMSEGEVICYDTFEKAVERAEYWLVKNGVDTDLATSLCIWNTGVKQPNCKYYQSYLSL